MNTFGIAEKSYNLMQVEFKKFSEIESVFYSVVAPKAIINPAAILI